MLSASQPSNGLRQPTDLTNLTTSSHTHADLPERVGYSDYPEVSAQHPAHEGLQEVQPDKYVVSSSRHTNGYDEKQAALGADQTPDWMNQSEENKSARRICGLVPRTFWIVIGVIAVLVIAGTVSGAVAGSLSQPHGSSSLLASDGSTTTSNDSPESTTPTASKTSVSSASVTTSEIVIAPSTTLFRDCPSVDNMVYSFGASGSPMYFRQFCGRSCWNVAGWDAIVNTPTKSLGDCIDLCASYDIANQTQISSGKKLPCNAVCWRNNLDNEFPGQCFGYKTVNVSGHFNISAEAICDSAAWMNQ